MHQRRPARREAGFSMLEIIIVMAIVAILMAVLIPGFLGQKRDAPNKSTIAAAQTFQAAAAEYLRSFPPVGGPDPLLSRGSFTGPFTPTLPPATGLYSAAGDPLVKSWPTNPFSKGNKTPVRVLRGACTTAPSLGDVLLCRPAGSGGVPDLQGVRVIAWGKGPSGATVKVYDTDPAACGGPCRVQ
jgi:prepilin-type N-terminal cleavage/methylation domain-containing protein